MRPLTRLCCALFVALLPLLSTLFMPTASAANFTVNSLADTPDANTSDGVCADFTGACTLRAALQQAMADPSGDVIGFSVEGLIILTSALPDISKSIIIYGPGESKLNLRRSTSAPYRIFTIGTGTVVHISGLTVRNGLVPLPANGALQLGGGGIYNAGDLTLRGVNVFGNQTSNSVASDTPVLPPGGGGIHNDGILTMTDCIVAGNGTGRATFAGSGADGGSGGGIFNAGTLVMTDCIVGDNHTGSGADSSPRSGNGGAGGGIYNASTMTLVRSTIFDNHTGQGGLNVTPSMQVTEGNGGAGGGIYNDIPAGGGEMKMTNCVVSNNTTGGGEEAAPKAPAVESAESAEASRTPRPTAG
jgi:CSLREA domain-containing protein